MRFEKKLTGERQPNSHFLDQNWSPVTHEQYWTAVALFFWFQDSIVSILFDLTLCVWFEMLKATEIHIRISWSEDHEKTLFCFFNMDEKLHWSRSFCVVFSLLIFKCSCIDNGSFSCGLNFFKSNIWFLFRIIDKKQKVLGHWKLWLVGCWVSKDIRLWVTFESPRSSYTDWQPSFWIRRMSSWL